MHLRTKPYPFAWVGYAYATLVGLVWGFLLSRGRVERHGRLVVFRGLPRWAFGRGGSCVGACYLTDQNVTAEVLLHEEIHRQQWRTYGLLMPFLYFLAGTNPHTNIFERDAGLEHGGYVRNGQDTAAPLVTPPQNGEYREHSTQ